MSSEIVKHDLDVCMVHVTELVPWSRNPRNNDEAARRLAHTIQVHGWTTRAEQAGQDPGPGALR